MGGKKTLLKRGEGRIKTLALGFVICKLVCLRYIFYVCKNWWEKFFLGLPLYNTAVQGPPPPPPLYTYPPESSEVPAPCAPFFFFFFFFGVVQLSPRLAFFIYIQ